MGKDQAYAMIDGVQPLFADPAIDSQAGEQFCMYPEQSLNIIQNSPVGALGKRFWLEIKVDAIMQFTGLLDKDGREIFEGDILEATRQTHEKQPLREGNKYSKVVFEDGAFMASQMVQLNSKKIYTHGYKVVGDVYTTPELLKK